MVVATVSLVSAARTWIGTPFSHQGRTKGHGVDCIGIAVGAAIEAGYEVDDRVNYGHHPTGELVQELKRQCYQVPRCEMQANDLMLFRFGRAPLHVAICAGDTMIHAYQPAGGVVEHNIDEKWMRRLVSVWRIKSWPRR